MAMWMLCRAAKGVLQSFNYRKKDVTPLLQTKVAIRAHSQSVLSIILFYRLLCHRVRSFKKLFTAIKVPGLVAFTLDFI